MFASRPRAGLVAVAAALVALAPAATAAEPPPAGPDSFPGAKLLNPVPPFLIHVAVKDYKDGTFHEDDLLTVLCRSERDAHLYLLYHQADGSTRLLFPNAVRAKNVVRAREVVAVPSINRDEARIHIRPPFGREVLQVVAAPKPIAEFDALDFRRENLPFVTPELLAKAAARLAKDPTQWAEHRIPIQTVAKEVRPPARPAARVGLFIGIGDYRDKRCCHTHEELRNSAVLMQKAMLERGGLDPQRTRLLLDEQATRAAIEESMLRWLPGVSRPGDTVFFYFSGHAGQVDDESEVEQDGKTELIGPWDLDGKQFRTTGILDVTLARWVEELEGRQVVLIFDTCHAGGLVRDKSIAKMFAKKAARLKNIAQLNTVVLTSTASDEQAIFDGTPDRTMWFTYFLTQAVRDLPAPLTMQAAHEFTCKGMKELFKQRKRPATQEPTLTDNALLPIALVP
jgi:hypothetical protein